MKNTTIATLFITVFAISSLPINAEYYGDRPGSSTADQYYPGATYRDGEYRTQDATGNLSGRTLDEANQKRVRDTTESMRRRAQEGALIDRTQ